MASGLSKKECEIMFTSFLIGACIGWVVVFFLPNDKDRHLSYSRKEPEVLDDLDDEGIYKRFFIYTCVFVVCMGLLG